MNTLPLSRALTKTAVITCFWIVFGLSMLLRNDLDILTVIFDFGKALMVSGVAWFFISILLDTFVKALAVSAKEHHVDRYKGGLSFYLAEPSDQEKAWYEEYQKENKQ